MRTENWQKWDRTRRLLHAMQVNFTEQEEKEFRALWETGELGAMRDLLLRCMGRSKQLEKWDPIQLRALETWGHGRHDRAGEIHAVLGLAGEAGEVADQFKKHLFKRSRTVTREEMLEELADVLYYVAIRATQLGVTLDELSLVFYEKQKGGHGWK